MRTGYDKVIAHRTDPIFAHAAKKDGYVKEVSDSALVIANKDGTETRLPLGRVFGNAPGIVIPHELVTEFKVGDKIKVGDIASYNSNYFQPDMFDKGQVIWKSGVLTTVALMESPDTHEDSCAISEKFGGMAATATTYQRDVVVSFEQGVANVLKAGDSVTSESILCTIEDNVSSDDTLFDAKTLEALKLLASATPKAKNKGTIERVEVYYNGELEDMSDSLRAVARQSDTAMSKRSKSLGKGRLTGAVGSGIRIEGEPLLKNTMTIRFYITADVSCGVGDKLVFANQMKSVIGRVMSGTNKAEDGRELDAIFGYASISNRIVDSPIIIGTTNALLKAISQQAAELYLGKGAKVKPKAKADPVVAKSSERVASSGSTAARRFSVTNEETGAVQNFASLGELNRVLGLGRRYVKRSLENGVAKIKGLSIKEMFN